MNKVFVVVLGILTLLGCGNSPEAKKKRPKGMGLTTDAQLKRKNQTPMMNNAS
ncbi:hypothetical protein [Klebsiella aerogenes]|uniref:hypothetical protein n=1 Tax=Klebsiella aerogenes TaxID=548 RepID=UPI000AF9F61C|nr:hypothetical protein [Klebsiella aerogenes]EMF0925881.1 hypothetical protein [Klebsiella aerogenes]